MSRLLLFLLTVAVVVLAVGYALRTHRGSTLTVASLLPKETVALVHLPDLEKSRGEWHRSDIYQLYREPSVQEFLRKPLSQLPRSQSFGQRSADVQQLDPKDAFLAVTSTANDQPTFVGGFRYRGSEADAEKIIGSWRSRLLGSAPAGAKTETVEYQKGPIQVSEVGRSKVCTTYRASWFLASNQLESLEATIDRLRGGGSKTAHDSLAGDETFRDAMGHMPVDYGVGFYLQPQGMIEKMDQARRSAGQGPRPAQLEVLSQIKSVCGATRFDRGKLHDYFFVGMPEQTKSADLTRNSLGLTSTDTFLYVAALLDLPKQFMLTDPSVNSAAPILGDRLQRIGRGLAAAGITPAQWEAVFGNELGALIDWHTDNRIPAPLVVFPVKDFAKAKPIAVALAHLLDDDGEWAESDRDGVHYISSPYKMALVTLQPTIAVSDRFLVAGFDLAAVQAALAHVTAASPDLSSRKDYRDAVKALPAPTRGFTFLDVALVYARLDAAFRPLLMMGAAFMPAMNEYVDIGKIPTPEVIAKHLSPIVSSQRYERDGYVSESVGPITMSQAGVGMIGAAVAGAAGYRYTSGLSLLPGFPAAPAGSTALPRSSTGPTGPTHPAQPVPSPAGTP